MSYKVYLRKFETLSNQQQAMMRQQLPPAELNRINQFSQPARQAVALQSRYWLRHYLSQWAELPLSDWQFELGQQGKPQLVATQQQQYALHFNMSHSRDYLAIAISSRTSVGVDVEQPKSRRNVAEIAQHYFSTEEQQFLASLQSEQQPAMFYRMWVLKEAVLKGLGVGISGSLGRYDFASLLAQAPALTQQQLLSIGELNDDTGRHWHCSLVDAYPEFMLAVSVQKQHEPPNWQLIDDTQALA
ncbi:4'-phosphopantetheinyl transferase superfamily protein [Shewanella avicenniae]|uniref:4'-phosphopantetheinyl transferase superfamily protein n=1 Tax=Shewanella avicenniae TaxID=2814294 RepID=A0ABX7QM71_9GAMM|nr:4'-phosphopantetheinyl transferase superfamily protein [Shewanella avicenniae]QSX32547.1 4'-phosphopantetheinyl transferase superfamily protein [Shewanella avicenniae]